MRLPPNHHPTITIATMWAFDTIYFHVLSILTFACLLTVGKLLELYGEGSTTTKPAAPGEAGEKVDRTVADGFEPAIQKSV